MILKCLVYFNVLELVICKILLCCKFLLREKFHDEYTGKIGDNDRKHETKKYFTHDQAASKIMTNGRNNTPSC